MNKKQMEGGDDQWQRNSQGQAVNQAEKAATKVNNFNAAVTSGDIVYAMSPKFKAKVKKSLALIEAALQIGPIGVSFSGGKDSVVTNHLVKEVAPKANVAFFDSGIEYEQTYEIIRHYEAEVFYPEMSLIEMCKYGGYWGYRGKDLVDPDAEFDFHAYLIGDPSHRFVEKYNLSVIAMGLRTYESHGREMNIKRRGNLYETTTWQWRPIFHLLPIAHWTDADIWAYIASNNLKYNSVYDKLAQRGVPREQWRISTLLGLMGATHNGKYIYLRLISPGVYNQLITDFPKLQEYV